MDHLGLVQPVDRLGQGVIEAVALAAHIGLNARFCEPFAAADGNVLRHSLGMISQCAITLGLLGMQGLLQGIQNELRVH